MSRYSPQMGNEASPNDTDNTEKEGRSDECTSEPIQRRLKRRTPCDNTDSDDEQGTLSDETEGRPRRKIGKIMVELEQLPEPENKLNIDADVDKERIGDEGEVTEEESVKAGSLEDVTEDINESGVDGREEEEGSGVECSDDRSEGGSEQDGSEVECSDDRSEGGSEQDGSEVECFDDRSEGGLEPDGSEVECFDDRSEGGSEQDGSEVECFDDRSEGGSEQGGSEVECSDDRSEGGSEQDGSEVEGSDDRSEGDPDVDVDSYINLIQEYSPWRWREIESGSPFSPQDLLQPQCSAPIMGASSYEDMLLSQQSGQSRSIGQDQDLSSQPGRKRFHLGEFLSIEFCVYQGSPRFDLRKYAYGRPTKQGVPLTYPRIGKICRHMNEIWEAMKTQRWSGIELQLHLGRNIYLTVLRNVLLGPAHMEIRQYCPRHTPVKHTEKGVYLDRLKVWRLFESIGYFYRQNPGLGEVDVCKHHYSEERCEECTPTGPPPTFEAIPIYDHFLKEHKCNNGYQYRSRNQ